MASKKGAGQDVQDVIQEAFQDQMKSLYGVLAGKYMTAAGDKGVMKQADQSFVAGLAVARAVRDQALVLASS